MFREVVSDSLAHTLPCYDSRLPMWHHGARDASSPDDPIQLLVRAILQHSGR